MMNKTSGLSGKHCLMFNLCSATAEPPHTKAHADIHTSNPKPTACVQTHTHTNTVLRWHTCTDKVNQTLRKMTSNTHKQCHIHTHTVVQSVEQACWVAVSTYSAAMATSSTAIDSAAKWVRVCECDNLVKITFKPNMLHKNALFSSSTNKSCAFWPTR